MEYLGFWKVANMLRDALDIQFPQALSSRREFEALRRKGSDFEVKGRVKLK